MYSGRGGRPLGGSNLLVERRYRPFEETSMGGSRGAAEVIRGTRPSQLECPAFAGALEFVSRQCRPLRT